jgi:hypothetical protein
MGAAAAGIKATVATGFIISTVSRPQARLAQCRWMMANSTT